MNKPLKPDLSIFLAITGTDNLYSKGPKIINAYRDFLNKKMFRVADTSLSYRQVNSLGDNGIIKESRKDKKDWRKFSFKELLFFSIIGELRRYGIRDAQLKQLHDAFFKPNNIVASDLSLIKIFGGIKIFLVVDGKANVFFYDILSFDLMGGEKYKSFININLNELFMDLWEKIGKKRIEYNSYLSILTKAGDILSVKEKEVIRIIRDQEYRSITVRKNAEENFIIRAEKVNKFNEKDLLEIIKKKNFADITILKRDGKIVNIKIEDTFKV